MPRIENSETLDVRGSLNVSNGTLTLKDDQVGRTKIAKDAASEHALRLDDLRVWDNMASLLPGTAATDDLAIIEGTFGTDAPTVRTSDSQSTSVTQRARVQYTLPSGYVSGGAITVRVRGGMITTVSDTTATVDVECYAYDGDGSVGSDLCTTAATTINSLTKGDDDFTITPTGLVSGDVLDIRITVAIVDSATGTAVIGEISKLSMMVDIR